MQARSPSDTPSPSPSHAIAFADPRDEAARLDAAGDAAPTDLERAAFHERALWVHPRQSTFAKLAAAVDRLRAADPGYLFTTHTLSRPLVVVTAANAAYMPLVEAMLSTIRFLRGGAKVRLALYDVGLEADQAERLRDRGIEVTVPDWHMDAAFQAGRPTHFKAMTARPYLPRYFADGALHLWIDADVWVQVPSMLDDIVLGAVSGALSIVAERHRAYRRTFRPLGETTPIDERTWLGRLYQVSFGAGDTAVLLDRPILNTGVFALRADAVHWAAWQHDLAAALARTRLPLVEQTALNHAVHRNGLPTVGFGALYNWVTHRAVPRYDTRRRLFVEPVPPHRPLGLIHVTGPGKTALRPVRTVDGRVVPMPLFPPAPVDPD